MSNKKIDCAIVRIYDVCAEIYCPVCRRGLIIRRKEPESCECGRQYVLRQSNWVEEIIDEQ